MPPVRKRFAQHFLIDKAVVEQIIRAINPRENERIVEIGPGKGALTLPLLAGVGRLDVVEIDRDLSAHLIEKCKNAGQLNLLQQDALQLDFAKFASPRIKVIGNLPYNISTPLIFHLLQFNHINQMIFMLQKEVADRICAKADTSDYGRLSIMVQAQCITEKLFEIKPAAFYPPPKVDSALLRLTATSKSTDKIKNYRQFSELVRIAFCSRRKQVSNGLKTLTDANQLEELNIPPSARPAELSVTDYINLANALKPRPP